MADDATGAVLGMVPLVMAVGILQKTTESMNTKKKKIKGFGLAAKFKRK